jgi:hypothetical protein
MSRDEHVAFHLHSSVLLFLCSCCIITIYGEFILCFTFTLTFTLICHAPSIYYWHYYKSPSHNHYLLQYPQQLYHPKLQHAPLSQTKDSCLLSLQIPLNCKRQNTNKAFNCNIFGLLESTKRCVMPSGHHTMA